MDALAGQDLHEASRERSPLLNCAKRQPARERSSNNDRHRHHRILVRGDVQLNSVM
jgi:hypothetical protein